LGGSQGRETGAASVERKKKGCKEKTKGKGKRGGPGAPKPKLKKGFA